MGAKNRGMDGAIENGGAMSDALAVYAAAVGRTHGLIDQAPDLSGGLAGVHARAEARLGRTRRLLAVMGDPHLAAPVVHVGGTSGKGSTSVAIAAVLTAAGYRTLLHTSPYLQVATEKLQVDGRLITAETFAAGVAAVLEAADRLGEGPITFPELWMGLVGWAIGELGVDAAVVEVGAGGRLDATNVVRSAVSVITSVGLDHTETLGPTIVDIARQKAGIVKQGAPVVTAVADPEALAVIRAEAALHGVALATVALGADVVVEPGAAGWLEPVAWRDVPTGRRYASGMAGEIQALNGATALATVRALRGLGWAIPEEAVRTGLAAGRLPGRLEVMPGASPRARAEGGVGEGGGASRGVGDVEGVEPGVRVVLDAAHNPEKAAALAEDLARSGRRCVGVVGLLAAKQAREVLAALATGLSALVATAPTVLGKPALPAEELAAVAREVGIEGVEVAALPEDALDRAVAMAGDGGVVLVTGSLFLVGELRGRWFPDAAVVAGRTAWPM